MKTLFKSKIIAILIIMGILFSCKNNQDGYSDEIDTHKTAVDTAETISDTTNSNKNNEVKAAGSKEPTVTSGKKLNESTAGKGSGPGEDVNDGSTYTSSSGLRKDSIDSKNSKNKGK
jgi:hypothetical protein